MGGSAPQRRSGGSAPQRRDTVRRKPNDASEASQLRSITQLGLRPKHIIMNAYNKKPEVAQPSDLTGEAAIERSRVSDVTIEQE